MKKSSFILGMIAGIVGIIGCGVLLLAGLNSPATQEHMNGVIIIAIVALLFQIVGLILAISTGSRVKTFGAIMIIAGITDIFAALASITGYSAVSLIICFVAAIFFITAGVFKIKAK